MFFAFCPLSFHTHIDFMPYRVSVQLVSWALKGFKCREAEGETERKYEMRKAKRRSDALGGNEDKSELDSEKEIGE